MKKRSIIAILIIIAIISSIASGCRKSVTEGMSSTGNTTDSTVPSDYYFDENGDLVTPDGETIPKNEFSVDEYGNLVSKSGDVIANKNKITSSQNANSDNKSPNNISNNSTSKGTISSEKSPPVTNIPDKTVLLSGVPKAEILPELTNTYLYPNSFSAPLKKNSTNIYENKYVRIDATHATEGYLLINYTDPWATDIEVSVELGEGGVTPYQYIRTEHYKFKGGEFIKGKPFAINLTKDDAEYYVTVSSIITGIDSGKMSVDLGRITAPGAITREYMLPSEEDIQVKQTSNGIYSNKYASINVTTASTGYFTVNYLDSSSSEVDIVVLKNMGERWRIYEYGHALKGRGTVKVPFTNGAGQYRIIISSFITHYYSKKAILDLNVGNISETGPFVFSSSEVLYNNNMLFIKKASELCKNCKNDFQKVEAIHSWLISYMQYKTYETNTSLMDYDVNLDVVYNRKGGVCFDFSVVLAAMLRSQNIACKVMVGSYVGMSEGHMWNEVYVNSSGSFESDVIKLTGKTWCRLDPTFSSVNKNTSIEYINNSANYVVVRVY